MTDIDQMLAEANERQRTGRLRDAEQLCSQVLQADPSSFEAHFLLGAVYHGLGKSHEAINSFRQAVQLGPDHAEAHNGLGVALLNSEKLDEAIASFQRAAEIKPDSAEISKNWRLALAIRENLLGAKLAEQRKFADAAACFRWAVELKPDYAGAHYNLGSALVHVGELNAAIASYRRSLELEPARAEAYNNLGVALGKQEKFDEAVACHREAVRLKPDYAAAFNNLGVALARQGKFDEAILCHRRALALRPDHAETLYNLAVALEAQNKPDEAAASYRRALELKPDYADAYHNLACLQLSQNQLEQAAATCRRAIEIKPDFGDAHHSHAMILLTMGRFAEGWAEYEWRFKQKALQETLLPRPRWTGEPLAGRTILLRGEQGHGDVLHFIRYASLVKQRGGTVVVECVPALASLVATCPGVDRVVPAGTELPPFDVYSPLLSLPAIFGTSLETIPAGVPYLAPTLDRCERWKTELGQEPGFRIGIAWQGNPAHPRDRFRSIPLGQFAAIAKVPGIRFYSLQAAAGREQLSSVGDPLPIKDLGDRLGDFHNTAALMRNLDLVITCDSAPAHLAGALGVPVWVALGFAADWRWMVDRADSPWYPTMRLFRQRRPSDWQEVFERIAHNLPVEITKK